MEKCFKKLWLCILMVAILSLASVPVFAETYYDSTGDDVHGYYLQTSTGTSNAVDGITVRLISNGLFNNFEVTYEDISLPAKTDGTKQRVVDALVAIQGDGSTAPQFLDVNGNSITSSSTYFRSVKYGNVTYAPPTSLSIQGWMFRINTQFPLISSYGAPNTSDDITDTTGNALGETISTAYIYSGDTITVYYDIPLPGSAAQFTRVASITNTSTTITAKIEWSESWFNGSTLNCWHILDFENFSGTAYLLNSAGQQLKTGAVSSGSVTFSGLTVTAGTEYIVKVNTSRNLLGNNTVISCEQDYTAE